MSIDVLKYINWISYYYNEQGLVIDINN